jgi:molybdopterin molybdotransferase
VIPYPEALRLLLDAAPSLEKEHVPLGSASGRFAADQVSSPMDQPPFANSAMDGFALPTGGAEVPPGSLWEVAGSVAAGDRPTGGSTEGPARAWEIMTGAAVPEGLDTVIPVEQVEVVATEGDRPTEIRIPGPVAPGLNIRPAGKDFRMGDPVLGPATRIGPVEVMALAALGIGEVPVFETPGAAVLCTGPELPFSPGRSATPTGRFCPRSSPRWEPVC